LKLNIDNYDATEHFGGIYYLYLRGMTNDKNSVGTGVYFRHITIEELTQLDELFSGEALLPEKEY